MYVGDKIVAKSFGEMMNKLCKIMPSAEIVESRIGRTKELICPTLVLINPENSICYCEHRKFNLIYALFEATMLFSNINEVEVFSFFNKKMMDYSDDGMTLNSAYGTFIAPNIGKVIKKLRSDPNTRQAVISIYNNDFCCIDSKDVPCTQGIQFLIRNNELVMITHMRSNDVFWGLQYDLYMFTNLQRFVAEQLGIECGPYIHMPASLHVYEYHWDMMETIAKNTESIIDFKAVKTSNIEGYNKGVGLIYDWIYSFDYIARTLDVLEEAEDGNISNVLMLLEIAYKKMEKEEFKFLIESVNSDIKVKEILDTYNLFLKRWFK